MPLSSLPLSQRSLTMTIVNDAWHFELFEGTVLLRSFSSPSYAGVIYITKLWLEWSSWSTPRLLLELDLILKGLRS